MHGEAAWREAATTSPAAGSASPPELGRPRSPIRTACVNPGATSGPRRHHCGRNRVGFQLVCPPQRRPASMRRVPLWVLAVNRCGRSIGGITLSGHGCGVDYRSGVGVDSTKDSVWSRPPRGAAKGRLADDRRIRPARENAIPCRRIAGPPLARGSIVSHNRRSADAPAGGPTELQAKSTPPLAQSGRPLRGGW